MRAEDVFRDYPNMKKELSILEFQLQQFQGIDEKDLITAMSFSHPEGDDRVQTSTLSDKTAAIAITYKKAAERENDEWFDFLWNRYNYLKEETEFFEHGIRSLDGILASIMTDLLTGDLSWDEIQSKYSISRMMITRYKKKAMSNLQNLYNLREKQVADYILG